MKVVIIEDEMPAIERLLTVIADVDPTIEVVACLESIEDTVNYLQTHAMPDLIFLDIHLSDGHSFEIFKQVTYANPIIFTTAYDQYALDAFKLCSIDYILKPVTKQALAAAINKFRQLTQSHIPNGLKNLGMGWHHGKFKKRFLGKVGQRLFFIETGDIACFIADNKIVHIVSKDGNRYLCEHTMERLEKELDPQSFFRLNRSAIVNIAAIEQVKRCSNSRMKLAIKGANLQDEIVISREKVADFRKWADA